ncbi:sigma-54-dependent Fis family transcriptional regulator [Desulforhopalus singaporensis]|uniref:Transcriptional regulator containing PAS, AAA-type ATPase, and DNA-binding Fis domains n=1 Tax=Desulforhopalus singaporensis TaxID=91360 RepID=A0A1H0KJK6_9BACT|nr:sigma 54-interacting transcriptional regulator [Desulforhopalus singaporensis]SDO56128.1 Transcriptional regulator containing PAS, AAA-type ATPase, and DNA-binding Fis domains [Desulforhopalus singaporensis]
MEPVNSIGIIPTSEQMRKEIRASHERSRKYRISADRRNENQERLSAAELEARCAAQQDLLEVVISHIDEFYGLLSPDDFIIAFADSDGYILKVDGGSTVKELFAEGNCAVGYRWTERDVGTSAISLCLAMRFPVQLNEEDHYCRQAHGFTSSAAPIFGKNKELAGVLVVSGTSRLVHSHTLIMITMAARSVEKQMRLLRRNREMSLYTGFLNRVIESAETGLLTLDTDKRIWKTNRKGKIILKQNDLEGKPVSVLRGLDLDLREIHRNPEAWKEREVRLQVDNREVHCYYSAKPVVSESDELLGAVMVFEEFNDLRKLADRISGTEPIFTFDLLVGRSKAFREAVELGVRAAGSSSTVLLLGETGTGKELFAQAIHKGGRRAGQSFVPLNCGAIPGELLESELFGYVDGAFTGASRKGRPGKFELADGGTILLDEIGDMPHDMQVKLLRVLQTGEVQRIGAQRVIHTNARVIAATHVDLYQQVALNRFRKDLFYRLNIIEIIIPPLRERGGEDIELLARHFVSRYGPENRISPDAMALMKEYHWPGNVRELENCVQRAIHLSNDGEILASHLGISAARDARRTVDTGTIREMERKLIGNTMSRNEGNMAKSSRDLGISRATLYRKVKEYGMDCEDFR